MFSYSLRILKYIWKPFNKRRVFISYHHANDEDYRKKFEKLYDRYIYRSEAVQIGDIDPDLLTDTIRQKIRDKYLRNSTVTVVLVGEETWKRKFIDWEISSSIRESKYKARSGLIGIVLPTHPSYGDGVYDIGIVPPRLVDNHDCDYAKIYQWSSLNPVSLATWIERAHRARNKEKPDDSYEPYVNNKSGDRWTEEAYNTFSQWLGDDEEDIPPVIVVSSESIFDKLRENVGKFAKENGFDYLAFITIGLGVPLALFGYGSILNILLSTAVFFVCLTILLHLRAPNFFLERIIGYDKSSDTAKLIFVTISLGILLVLFGYWTKLLSLIISSCILWGKLRWY